MKPEPSFVSAFREAAPYIHYLHDKTVVLSISSHVLASGHFPALAQDIALLNSLGVRIVLIHGVRSFMEENTQEASLYCQGYRVTNEAMMTEIKHLCGAVRLEIEAALGMGFLHAPAYTAKLSVAGGNFISAKPLGVLDGIDMQFTGQVRKIDSDAIRRCLDNGQLVLISPVGHSLGGTTYNLSLPETAAAVARALNAEKLVFLSRAAGIIDKNDQLLPNLSAKEARQHCAAQAQHEDIARILPAALSALESGVHRVQIIDGVADGSLLCELFTRHGVGTALAHSSFTEIRPAVARDIPDLMGLIEPMIKGGILLPRTRDDIENHIHEFFVAEYDDLLYGCAALKCFADIDAAEISCLAVAENARGKGYGDLLLEYIENHARQHGIARLFALTTRTADWFAERGFTPSSPQDLPAERRQQYSDNKRQSKVFVKSLS